MINKITAKEAHDNVIKSYEEYLNKEENKYILDRLNEELDAIYKLSTEGYNNVILKFSDKDIGEIRGAVLEYLDLIGYTIEDHSSLSKVEGTKKREDSYTIKW